MNTAKTHLLIMAVAALLAVGACSTGTPAPPAQAAAGTPPPPRKPTIVAGEVLVKFKISTTTIKPFVMSTLGASVKRQLGKRGDLVLATLPSGMAVADAVASFKKSKEVVFAEPNYIYKTLVEPNDQEFGSDYMWGMKGGFGSQATTAWDTTTDCSSVYVGVVDTGIQVTHPDLADNMWRNAGELPGDGIDNDGNGYIDDVHGYNFAANHSNVYSADDGDYHGSHLAGTVAASGNNQIGVAGMCWRANLISSKFITSDGGSTADAIRAIDYITDLKRSKGLNIVATVNSWGCAAPEEGCFSQALLEAINRGWAQGILFIAAAGNDASSTMPIYPAAYSPSSPAVIAVASIDSSGELSSFSNSGAWVNLGAPGNEILSTYPEDSYVMLSGTSMAVPHVAGAAALYKARWPTATANDIRAAILGSVTPTPSLGGGVTSSGGRLNVAAMLAVVPPSVTMSMPSPPSPPPPCPSPRPPPPAPPPPPPKSVTLFEHCHFYGVAVSFRPGYYNANKPATSPSTDINDMFSSVKVPAGLTLVLWQEYNHNGNTLTVVGPAEVPCLIPFNFNDKASSWKVVDTATHFKPSASYCYRYSITANRTATIFYKSNDCSPKWGFGATDPKVGAGGNLKAFPSPSSPGLAKYCYRYAGTPNRVLFYASDECTPKYGFGANLPGLGSGGEVWLYSSAQPNTVKFCYRHANNPLRTLIYRSNDCTPKWGWGYNHRFIGSGGEVWAPL